MILKNVCKSFDGKPVLNNLSLEIKTGDTVLITAPSGTGKTTLLRLMMGLDAPDSGEIIGRADNIAAVFQEDRLPLEFTPLACIKMTASKGVTREKIIEHLSEVGLEEAVSKPISQLSGGMRRRVAIVRAVINNADTIYFDEPFTGLDRETKIKVIAYIKKHTVGKTLVFVSHDAEDETLLNAKKLKL